MRAKINYNRVNIINQAAIMSFPAHYQGILFDPIPKSKPKHIIPRNKKGTCYDPDVFNQNQMNGMGIGKCENYWKVPLVQDLTTPISHFQYTKIIYADKSSWMYQYLSKRK